MNPFTFRALSAATVMLVAATSAYAENPNVGGSPMYANKNIVENAMNSKDHTTLVAAVKAADLVETLKGKGHLQCLHQQTKRLPHFQKALLMICLSLKTRQS